MGSTEEIIVEGKDKKAFEKLQKFIDKKKSWVFGYFSYDLKNSIENLESNNSDQLDFPTLYFFRPAYLVKFNHKDLEVLISHPDYDYKEFLAKQSLESNPFFVKWNQSESKEDYLQKIRKVKKHIHLGDVYELNYCFQFYKENQEINPWLTFVNLDKNTRAPFACYFQKGDHFLMSGSPERFLQKSGDKVISQPIKGTIRRGLTDEEDLRLKKQLRNDPKERSENIMITDLVRNDLSRTAIKGSVRVEELCEIYSFNTVHQMISTVSSRVDSKTPVTEIIKNAFPMGSMTGAPKVRAMELIEELETTKRGIYSGAVGYFTPEKDFDFNVVIRSLMYNAKHKFVSAMVGGAITAASDEEREYEECLLKAASVLNSLS